MLIYIGKNAVCKNICDSGIGPTYLGTLSGATTFSITAFSMMTLSIAMYKNTAFGIDYI
jgi:hypothetical protein